MEKLSFYFALWSAKAAQLALRIIRRGGTTAPGKVALAICPDFLSRIGRPDTLIGVTGTNGKTTVSNMLCDIFESMGMDIVSNREGANIDAGAATSLVAAATPGGKCRKKLGVLEMEILYHGGELAAAHPAGLELLHQLRRVPGWQITLQPLQQIGPEAAVLLGRVGAQGHVQL